MMTTELLAMLGGGISGFIMKLIASQMQNQAIMLEGMIKKQQIADQSADAAAKRDGGVMVRRFLVGITFFAIVLAPFIVAFTEVGVTLQEETKGLLGLFKGSKLVHTQGYLILPEVRQTALAIVGFYFGSSQVK
jgi:hypothetical protein